MDLTCPQSVPCPGWIPLPIPSWAITFATQLGSFPWLRTYALYASDAHQPSRCNVSWEAPLADKCVAPPILRECRAYSSARPPANATTSRRVTVAYCFVHMDHLPPPPPYSTRGATEGTNKYQDINSSIRSTAPPPAPTGLDEPARTCEITAPLRNWSPLDPRNRTSMRSALDHCATPKCARPRKKATSARRKQHVSWMRDRVSANTSDARVKNQNDAHNASHNTRPRLREAGIKVSPASNTAHDTGRRTVA